MGWEEAPSRSWSGNSFVAIARFFVAGSIPIIPTAVAELYWEKDSPLPHVWHWLAEESMGARGAVRARRGDPNKVRIIRVVRVVRAVVVVLVAGFHGVSGVGCAPTGTFSFRVAVGCVTVGRVP